MVRHPVLRRFACAVAAAVAIATLVGCSVEDEAGPVSAAAEPGTASATTVPAPESLPPVTEPPPLPPPPPPLPGIAVADVDDGDTITLVDGQRVRLIGIDTPERGECGYREATAALEGFIAGRPVTLVPGARDDRDRYDRLLRYVEVGGVDLNLAMVSGGWARSRYDSRDGYGRHAREDAYVAADVGTSSPVGCAGPAPERAGAAPTPIAPATGGADPRFSSCSKARAAGFGPYTRGVDVEYDWYNDGDGDGVVCEFPKS